MVVIRLLSYWGGNFSGAMLNFGRVAFAPIIMEAEDYRDLKKIMVLPTTHTRTLKKAGY